MTGAGEADDPVVRIHTAVSRLLADLLDESPEDPAASDAPLLIAVSGGTDSMVLLDLVAAGRAEASVGTPRPVVVAHVDHGMRPESGDDARAVRDRAEKLDLPFEHRRLDPAPTSETAARRERYRALHDIADRVGAIAILTAHHADDQAETVLHRMARGTGVAGLHGIPRRRGCILRPFLATEPPFGRSDLERLAHLRDIPVRHDPTNERLDTPRNRIRHRVLPELEKAAPGARDRIVRLSRNARRSAAELRALADALLGEPAEGETTVEIPVELWSGGTPALRRALVRRAMERIGRAPSAAVTRALLRLSPDAQSGRGVDLPGGLRFERRFDGWVLGPTPTGPLDERVAIPGPRSGRSELRLPGRTVDLVWGPSPSGNETGEGVALDADSVEFPLVARGWRAGDRIARPFGHVAVAKWLAERRVPRSERQDRIVVEDATGTVVAAAGLGVDPDRAPTAETARTLYLEPLPK